MPSYEARQLPCNCYAGFDPIKQLTKVWASIFVFPVYKAKCPIKIRCSWPRSEMEKCTLFSWCDNVANVHCTRRLVIIHDVPLNP